MKNISRLAVLGLAMAAVVGFTATVSAQGQSKEAIVKHRQATMKRQGHDLKSIAIYAKGGGGTQAEAEKKVADLQAISHEILSLFKPGTSSADLPGKTYAKPIIWKQWKEFEAIIPKVQAAEQRLSDAVKKNDKHAILAAIGNLGKNGCGACHSTYREKIPR